MKSIHHIILALLVRPNPAVSIRLSEVGTSFHGYLFRNFCSSGSYQDIIDRFVETKEVQPSLPRHIVSNSGIVCTQKQKHVQTLLQIFDNRSGEQSISKKSISNLRDALMNRECEVGIDRVLDEHSSVVNARGSFVFLLKKLQLNPDIALQIFNWKRSQPGIILTLEEYSKAIAVAGKAKHISLAIELFEEMKLREIEMGASAYNALMIAYVCNGMNKEAVSLFENLKQETNCCPTIVTYNILLSIYGRSLLVTHMEMIFEAICLENLTPTVYTYNILIAGYLTARMWDKMDESLKSMKASFIEPNMETYSLLARGYAHSGRLNEMEEAFSHLEDRENTLDLPVLLAIIHAYSKSNQTDKMMKIERLIGHIPKGHYRPWLDVLLIRNYANTDSVEKMENSIRKALERKTVITAKSVPHSVSACYFRCNEVEKLEIFVKQAAAAGWLLTRSLYHSRMVMYGLQNRLNEMENVFAEMVASSPLCPTKKTFLILYKFYCMFNKEKESNWTLKRMREVGFSLPDGSKKRWLQISY